MLDLYNKALIHDEVLLNIVLVIEYDFPVGPSFVYALSSLVEAAVIHNAIYFDPMHQTVREDSASSGTVANVLNSSSFVKHLLSENILTLFPDESDVTQFLKTTESDYQFVKFLADYYHGIASFAFSDPDFEIKDLTNLTDLLDKAPGVFMADELLLSNIEDNEFSMSELSTGALAAISLGFNQKDLHYIDTRNHKAKGYIELSQALGINLYPVLTALPYQIGAIKNFNSRARKIYDRIAEEVKSLGGETQDEETFARVSIPPLAQIVLERSEGSVNSLIYEICSLRHRHEKFRHYLSDFEKNWATAKYRSERIELRNNFDNAWNMLLSKNREPSTRIIYTLWDILKSPTDALIALGDSLKKYGHEESILGKVRGLHDFWQELVKSPLPERNLDLIHKISSRLVGQDTWRASKKLAHGINEFLG